MSEKVRDIVYGVAGTVLGASLLWVGNVSVDIRDAVRSLQQYHSSEWPLERQLLSAEIAVLRAEIATNKADIAELERRLQEQL